MLYIGSIVGLALLVEDKVIVAYVVTIALSVDNVYSFIVVHLAEQLVVGIGELVGYVVGITTYIIVELVEIVGLFVVVETFVVLVQHVDKLVVVVVDIEFMFALLDMFVDGVE